MTSSHIFNTQISILKKSSELTPQTDEGVKEPGGSFMKIRYSIAIFGSSFLVPHAYASGVEVRPGEYIVKLKRSPAIHSAGIRSVQSAGLMIQRKLGITHDYALVIEDQNSKIFESQSVAPLSTLGKFVSNTLDALQGLEGVEFAEPNFVYRISMGSKPPRPNPTPPPPPPTPTPDPEDPNPPNDPLYKDLWGMKKIRAFKGWELTRGNHAVIVAVVDTGVDYKHPDLSDNIWKGEDGSRGYNAITQKTDPMDDHGHGTHCSGTIGASGDNQLGVIGVDPEVQIMGIKFMSAKGSGDTADAVEGIDWAVARGARVLSNSWGGGGASKALRESIVRAGESGAVFVVASGNDNANTDKAPQYPAAYNDLSNVISIGSSTSAEQRSSFSNYGLRSVDVFAPGTAILSTIPGGKYGKMSGTSMATPHVAGAVALLMSREPNLTPAEIKMRVMATADQLPAYKGLAGSGARLNVERLLLNQR
jgi:thermitase